MSDINSVKTQIQTLIDLANTTTGNSDTNLTDGVNALVEGFGQGGSGGIEGGYDVMFYDENNEGLAFYSIKSGHSINPPVYNCNSWKTGDGEVVVFPYTPTTDLIVYAFSSSYVSALYEHYGVDKNTYPYVLIQGYDMGAGTYVRVLFFKTHDSSLLSSGRMYPKDCMFQQIENNVFIAVGDGYLDAIYEIAMKVNPSLKTATSQQVYFDGTNGGLDVYTNYEISGYSKIHLLE